MDTWIPTRTEKPMDKIIELTGGEDKPSWVPPLMAGLLTAFCTSILLSLIRPPLVVYRTKKDTMDRAASLQTHALLAWSLVAGAVTAMLVFQE